MNVNGVLASINFPSWPGLGGQFFAQNDDKDVAKAMIRAYNDWHIEEWCGAYPGRFIPLTISGFTLGGEWMAEEIRRMAEKGVHAVSCTPSPTASAARHARHEWDAAWQPARTPARCWCSTSAGIPNFMPRSPFDVIPHVDAVPTALFAAELLWSPMLRKFPKLKMALAEGGIGWVPLLLGEGRLRLRPPPLLDRGRLRRQAAEPGLQRQVQTCFIDDETGLASRDQIGVDMITWEADYPHSDATWPQSPERLMKSPRGGPGPRRRDQ